jgi:hypothetical protein
MPVEDFQGAGAVGDGVGDSAGQHGVPWPVPAALSAWAAPAIR